MRNDASRRSLERIGATEDRIVQGDRVYEVARDTVYYRIDATDWPSVERHLLRLLDRDASTAHSG